MFYFLGEVSYTHVDVKKLLFFLPCLSSLNPSDVTETEEVAHEKSKPAPCEASPAAPEAGPETSGEAQPPTEDAVDNEPTTEASIQADEASVEPQPVVETEAEPAASPEPEAVVLLEADSEPELEADPEADVDTEPEAEVETEAAETAAEALDSSKEAEDDHLSVSIPNEDAITLDVDGDDLLETGKHVKLPDPDKSSDDHLVPSGPTGHDDDDDDDDDLNTEESGGHKEGKNEAGSKADPTKKEGRDTLKKAETGDKEKDSGKKGPSTTGASGQAKRFVFLCQFFDTTTTSKRTRKAALWVASRFFFFLFLKGNVR